MSEEVRISGTCGPDRARQLVLSALVEAGVLKVGDSRVYRVDLDEGGGGGGGGGGRGGRGGRGGGGGGPDDDEPGVRRLSIEELEEHLVAHPEDSGAWLLLAEAYADAASRSGVDVGRGDATAGAPASALRAAEEALWDGTAETIRRALRVISEVAPGSLHAAVASFVRAAEARELSASRFAAAHATLSEHVYSDRFLTRRGRWILTRALANASGEPDELALAQARDEALASLAAGGVSEVEVHQFVRRVIQRDFAFGGSSGPDTFLRIAVASGAPEGGGAVAAEEPAPRARAEDDVMTLREAAVLAVNAFSAARSGNVGPAVAVAARAMTILETARRAGDARRAQDPEASTSTRHRTPVIMQPSAVVDSARACAYASAVLDMADPGAGAAGLVRAVDTLLTLVPQGGQPRTSGSTTSLDDSFRDVAVAIAATPGRVPGDAPTAAITRAAAAMPPENVLGFAEKFARTSKEGVKLLGADRAFMDVVRRLIAGNISLLRLESVGYFLRELYDARLPAVEAELVLAALGRLGRENAASVSDETMSYVLVPALRAVPAPRERIRPLLEGPFQQAPSARLFTVASAMLADAAEGRPLTVEEVEALVEEARAWRDEAPTEAVFSQGNMSGSTGHHNRMKVMRFLLVEALPGLVSAFSDHEEAEHVIRAVVNVAAFGGDLEPEGAVSNRESTARILNVCALVALKAGLPALASESFERSVGLVRETVAYAVSPAAHLPLDRQGLMIQQSCVDVVKYAAMLGMGRRVAELLREVTAITLPRIERALEAITTNRTERSPDQGVTQSLEWWTRLTTRAAILGLQAGLDVEARRWLETSLRVAEQLVERNGGTYHTGSANNVLVMIIKHAHDGLIPAVARLRGRERVEAYSRLAPIIRRASAAGSDESIDLLSRAATEIVGGRAAYQEALLRWMGGDERRIRDRIVRDAPYSD